MSEFGADSHEPGNPAKPPGPYLIVGATSFGVFLSALDASIVNVSLATMAASFGVDIPEIQWVVLSYLLAITSLMPLMGKLGDRFGKTKVFQSGMVIFVAGSLACALSPSLTVLVASRVLQAIGSSMMSANGLALVTYYTTPENRGRAIGLNSITLAAALGLGPVVGGILSEFFGWPSIFLVNLPIGFIGFIVVAKVVPDTEKIRETRFDALGAGLFFAFLFLLVYYVSIAVGLSLEVSLVFMGSIVAACVALLVREQRFPVPVIPTRVMADRRISVSIFSALLAYMAIVPITFLFPFFLQRGLGFSQSITGIILTAHPLVISIAGPVSGFISERVQARIQTVIGLAIEVAGLLLFGLAVPNLPFMILSIVVMGSGLSLFSVANGNFIMTSAPKEYMGVVSALTNLARTTGFSVATALVTTVFGFFLILFDPNYSPANPVDLLSYSAAFQLAVWVFCALALVGMIISAFRGLSPAEHERVGEQAKSLEAKRVC
ncbi:MAG: MFS transporter [Candidatus Thorarchaeota archaeon]|nr:MAG: MFS transporter [Candidatus Thorarchaeota archaeon]